MNSANNAIENFINGNLSDAKRLARRVPGTVLFDKLKAEYGKDDDAAMAISAYLKGKGSFQAACDAYTVAGVGGIGKAGCRANARLIAAAPDLLEACKVAAENIEKGYPIDAGSILEILQTAITKATQ